ncbi:MAG: DHH family phosphoesterase, partial [Bacteroidia bacterium]|nr:DHH family phosphoesterase [Bacteroidia bacterium]MDW8058092.1 DHH family phosphoesterase [Bacteroidia bacterium]
MKLRGLLREWIIPEELPFLSLSEEIPPPIQRALFRRNLRTVKEVHNYFYPDPNNFLPIEQLPDVERALSLLHESIVRGHFIFVVGDYDVDGTVSAALLGSFFRAVGHTGFHLHLPDRFKEGYGVSDYAVELALSMGSSLFIAVDCGTKDAPRLQRLKKAGLRVIVLDHHAIGEGEKMPDVDAFVNPQRPDSSYPNRYLSAGALTYKLLRAYQERYGQPESWEGIDLAAISILSDIMPLVGENRVIVYSGLEVM